jgi:polyhydroxyalkanoate synthesis regulator phasin
MAAKKPSSKTTKKAKAGARSKKAATKKPAAKKGKAKKAPAKRGRATGLDKSVEQFRESLEHSVTLSRDRLQEVVDDAVKRGRMTRSDAEKMLSDLVKRGRRQTDALLKELERMIKQARKEIGGRTAPARKQATQAAQRARKKLK